MLDWLTRIFAPPDPDATYAGEPGPFDAVPRDAKALGDAAMERLAEDEALRGDLTDDGFLPLQAWAFARLERIAVAAVRYPHPAKMMDAATEMIRAFVGDAVYAAQNGDAAALAALAALIRPRIVPRERVAAVQAALQSLPLTADPDANAQAIAAALGA